MLKNRLYFLLFLFLSCCPLTYSQIGQARTNDIDSSSFMLFKKKKVIYSNLGYYSAPFSVKFQDSLGKDDRLIYRNNARPTLGFGFSYKWFSVSFALSLPTHIRPVSKYGDSKYINLGFDFNTKSHYYDVDFHNYQGYAIKDAYKWNDTLSKNVDPNLILSNLNALSFSVNAWRFLNKNIKINILRGVTGLCLKEQKSIYIKTTFNFHQFTKSEGIIPFEKRYTLNSKLNSNLCSSYDFGFIPGYVYLNRIKNWQFSGMFGAGLVVQIKSYIENNNSRTYLGLAPRYDFRVAFGYNVPKFFINLITEFDNKSIRFNDLKFQQTFYMIKLVGGIRI